MSRAEEFVLAAGEALQRNDLPSAQDFVTKALLEDSSWPLRGHVLHAAGFVFRMVGNPNAAVDYFREFVNGAGDDGNGVPMSKVHEGYYMLALSLRQRGEPDIAVDAYRKAAKGFRASGNTQYLCYALTNLAWAACMRNLTDEAKSALDEAALLVDNDNDRQHLRLSLALYHHVSGANDEATDIVDELIENAADFRVKSHAAWLKAHIHLYNEDKASALEMANLAEEFAVQSSDPKRLLADVSGLRKTLSMAG